jgi:hypothetical protein
MTGLTDREAKLFRLAVDAGATQDEANAASEKFIAMLQGRQYNIDVQGSEPKIAAQHIEDLGDILDLQVRRIDRLSLPRAESMPCPPQVEQRAE